MFVAPYDDPYTIAGQGTVGQEILKQCPDSGRLSHIFVPVGGGGLIAGIAAYVKAVRPDIKVIGVEPSGAPAKHHVVDSTSRLPEKDTGYLLVMMRAAIVSCEPQAQG